MKPRALHIFVSVVFLAALCSAGLIQLFVEVRRGECPQVLDLIRQRPTVAHLRAYEQQLEDTSWVARKLRPWMQSAQFILLKDAGEKALVGHDGWLFYKPGVQFLTQRPGARSDTGTTTDAVTAILDFRDQLAARGIPLLVMPVPNKESVYPEQLTYRPVSGRRALSAETREVLQRLTLAGIEVVDLFAAFADAKAASPPSSPALYLAEDSHWSPAGVELAARTVAQRIVERGWVKNGSVPYEIRPASIHRVGDLLRMMQAPPIERLATPEEVPCVQVVRRDKAQPYQDTADSAILILGDSFLRIYEQDEPGSAGFIAHLAKELHQPLTSLVSDGGASTLVRQELFRRPALLKHKQVVVWEFVERDIRLGTEGWQQVPLPPQARTETRSSGHESAQ